ncbi:hypothetical protein J1N35_037882 [Gossypium stocksii]|uniref:Uncharacterized protein n=1 Tax=Gossypium stocksii TaxID=47602 RepID=A0A9D3UKS9_9ROSI|nr:hypothetical protein J1N35_037882 [Gossypium stocksii]
MITSVRTMSTQISEALPLWEYVVHDVPNLDPEDPRSIIDHLELDNSSQQEFGTEDHGDKLNMDEIVSNPIDVGLDIIIDVVANVKVEVTTNVELKWILNRGVEELIHLLAIAKKVLAEEIDEFDLFSSDKGIKARATKTSHDMERGKLEAIIHRKMIWGWLEFGSKWLVMWM